MRVRHTPHFALGYFQHNSHEVLPVESCPISSPLINQAITAVWKLERDGAVPQSLHGLQFFANHDDTKLLVEAYVTPDSGSIRSSESRHDGEGVSQYGGPSTPLRMTAEIQPFGAALHGELPHVVGVVVFPASAIEDESRQRPPLTAIHPKASRTIGDESLICHVVGHDYRVSGGSFFQTNRFLTDTLVQTVVADRKGRGALDLYAGAGLFTAQLARNFDTVLAVESSPHAFADLRHNVPSNVKCIRSTTEKFLAAAGRHSPLTWWFLIPRAPGWARRLPERWVV